MLEIHLEERIIVAQLVCVTVQAQAVFARREDKHSANVKLGSTDNGD
jgi:hypothetical protein